MASTRGIESILCTRQPASLPACLLAATANVVVAGAANNAVARPEMQSV